MPPLSPEWDGSLLRNVLHSFGDVVLPLDAHGGGDAHKQRGELRGTDEARAVDVQVLPTLNKLLIE